jgi:hypothetical protein
MTNPTNRAKILTLSIDSSSRFGEKRDSFDFTQDMPSLALFQCGVLENTRSE